MRRNRSSCFGATGCRSPRVDYRASVTSVAQISLAQSGTTRVLRWLGTVLVVAGLGLLVWAGVVWKWGDPFTAAYTAWEQRKLDRELDRLVGARPEPPPLATAPEVPGKASSPEKTKPVATAPPRRMTRQAASFRDAVESGGAIGRLRVPRLGVNMVMVEGTDASSLKRGPGRDARTFMPGEGKLVYIAGHRTTYSAPLAKIDTLRIGDRITVEMPYGTFVYAVSRHRIVDDEDLSVLKSGSGEELALQACHPRFFASQRYIVWALPVRGVSSRGRMYSVPTPS